jgi:bile acid:Na+ symporter, BASS family
LISHLTHFLHRHFLLILCGAYVLSGILPQPGLLLRSVSFGEVHLFGSTIKVSLSLLMLSFLLLNAGLGIDTGELKQILKRPTAMFAGFLANLAVPVLLILSMRGVMELWHSNDELQNLLVGLALIVSMPIAGSSTAWAQNANGNVSLSMGLVFLSTILSPFTTPYVLHIFGHMTGGDYSEDLHELAKQGTDAFMMLTVVLPSFLGIVLHYVFGDERVKKIKPVLKFCNFVVLILLNYSNAATTLPQVFGNTDVDFLALVCGTTFILCATAFAAGWLLSKILKSDKSEQAALMFGLGMNNNGTGLVLATATLSDHPNVLLPMIFYTLAQQLIAAFVDWKLFRQEV